ncbi:trypsin-like peptidase domain-containing protein [Streptomyces monomycini]|uniref:VMAP-C domain-containing protein n=1 Tax=Streptomyces monomycini TaxID=371720 RepID=UPI001EEC34AB|nr:trypsin-like peptidase domain-containing protein [Streptomyces monomycini]
MDQPLFRSFVSVRDTGKAVGAGVLLGDDLVLTCAHVVNSALGRDRYDQTLPGPGRTVRVRLPHVAPDRDLTARVEPALWSPPRATAAAGSGPVPPGAQLHHGDLAVLRLPGPAPAGAEPAPFLPHAYGNEVIALWASGHPLPTVRAVPRVSAPPWVALDVVGGTEVREGFSGGPLWDRDRQAVVGLVVADLQTPAAARQPQVSATLYAISVPAIEAELPDLPPPVVPTARRGVQQLLAVLETILSTPDAVRACEELLASRLLRPSLGPGADLDRLVGLAVGVRRGVPELLQAVRETMPAGSGPQWERLRRVARAVSPGESLTRKQQRDLNGLLAHCGRTDPRELLADVLPHAIELPAVTGLADTVGVLEGFEAQGAQPMPPLLQGVVRIGVDESEAGAYPAGDLEAWTERTALRLGVDVAAVRQYAADVRGYRAERIRAAAEHHAVRQAARPTGRPPDHRTAHHAAHRDAWPPAGRAGVGSAAVGMAPMGTAPVEAVPESPPPVGRPPVGSPPVGSAPSPNGSGPYRHGTEGGARLSKVPRVQVELLPTATGRHYTYQVWAWSGGDAPHHLVLARDTEVTSEQVVDDIHRVLVEEIREDPEPALVEFFLPAAWLGLPVDRWESFDSDEDGPFGLGFTRRVVIRTAQRSRASYAGWKRRTAALDTARSLVLDHGSTDRKVARARLEMQPEVGTVIVCCEPRHHGALLRQCVQAGVHTVLWHREEHGESVAADLLELVEGGHHTQLPETVRLERAKAVAEVTSTGHRGRQLSLMYDAPDHRPPQLAPDAWVLTQP